MTENEAIYGILNRMKPYLNDDTEISPREVSFKLANQRALLIRNELNKNRTIDPVLVQDLGCIALEAVDPAECCNVTTGCKVIKTSVDIPSLIELHNDYALTRVGPVNKTLPSFSKTTLDGAKWVGNGKYTSNEIFYYLHNKRIYLVSKTDRPLFITNINVMGVLENPVDANSFINCSDGSTCYSADTEYPMKAWMYNYAAAQIIQEYAQLLNLPADVMNDGSDNTATKLK